MAGLKYEGFGAGDRIRAYHFEPCHGRPDRYLVGVVLQVVDEPYRAYRIAVERDVEEGRGDLPLGLAPEALVSMESLTDFDGRVTLESEHEGC